MRLLTTILIIAILLVGCNKITEPVNNTLKLEQTDLEQSPDELVAALKLIETWTLNVLDAHEQFTSISETQKEEMINELSDVYTDDAAHNVFSSQYRLLDGEYQRVPVDYLSIQHIEDNIKVQETVVSDQIILEISGEVEKDALITARYYIEPTTYKLMDFEIDSPY